MNKRIRELRRQATLVETYTTNDGTVAEGNSVDLEKFAELIVQECTDLVQKYMTRWPEDCELTKQIKEHFGVEE